MRDSESISFGSNTIYPRFDKDNYKYSYIFGKITKITICEEIYTKINHLKGYLVRTEYGNLRTVDKKKIFETKEEAQKYKKRDRNQRQF